MKRIVECVPNFSEGRNAAVIDRIVAAITACPGVSVLDRESGKSAGRSVVTFAGEPEAVCEAAFRGVAKAQELIDMRQHHGVHPRIGATDVLPLIPVSGVTLEECAALARSLAERIFTELGIPCYLYGAAALKPGRSNLAVCRAGGYESLPDKIADPARRPDFSPEQYNDTVARSGATCVGARDFLIAVNFNLDSESAELASEIAMDVREKGRKVGSQWQPGTLKGCKAIGWYIEEYGYAQVSMNICDSLATPLHVAYAEVSRAAAARGTRVTGAEIVGLIPERVLLETQEHMSLDLFGPGDIRSKVLEYRIENSLHYGSDN